MIASHSLKEAGLVHLVRAYSNRSDLLERLAEVVEAVPGEGQGARSSAEIDRFVARSGGAFTRGTRCCFLSQ